MFSGKLMAVTLIAHCWYFVEDIFNQEFWISLASSLT